MKINLVPLRCGVCQAPLTVKTHLQPFVICDHCGTQNAIVWDDNGSASISMSTAGVVFNLSIQDIQEIVTSELLKNPYHPLDVLSNTEITEINRILVPVYWADDCIGTGYVMYDKSYPVQSVIGSGDNRVVVDKTEWRTETAKVSATKDYIVSANREYYEIIRNLYANRNLAANNDIRLIDMKHVAKVAKKDILEQNIFAGFIRPRMEEHIKKKAKILFTKKRKNPENGMDVSDIRNLQVNGIKVFKREILSLWVEICEVIYNYNGSYFKIFLSDNGSTVYYLSIPLADETGEEKTKKVKNEIKETEAQSSRLLMEILATGVFVFVLIFIGSFLGIEYFINYYESILGLICLIGIDGLILFFTWIDIRKMAINRKNKLNLIAHKKKEYNKMRWEAKQTRAALKVRPDVEMRQGVRHY